MAGPDTHSWKLVASGFLVTLIGGLGLWLSEAIELAWGKPVCEGTLALVLLWLYPEKESRRWSISLVIWLVVAAIGLAAFWVAAVAWGRTKFLDVSQLSITAVAVTLVGAVVTAPIYEEKVVRGLLLDGLSRLTNGLAAAVLVSLVFGFVHAGPLFWPVVFSLALCMLALKWRVSTLQRALVHGIVNLLVLLWYGTKGYGLFL